MEERGAREGEVREGWRKKCKALAQDKPTEEAFCGISWARRDKNKCCDQFCPYEIIKRL